MPRAILLVTEEAGTRRRLLVPLKSNIGPDNAGFAFLRSKAGSSPMAFAPPRWCRSDDPVTISADEALATARKSRLAPLISCKRHCREGPVDQTEIVRRGKEAGFTVKNLRTAREELGVTTRKEGFGRDGRVGLGTAGMRTVLQLVTNNEARKKTTSDNGELPASGDGSGQVVNRPDQPENGPDGGNVA